MRTWAGKVNCCRLHRGERRQARPRSRALGAAMGHEIGKAKVPMPPKEPKARE
jgi:hypothetical protein